MADTAEQSGFILINKPVGPTSHDIIDKLRRITGLKKIGHAGTLDPLASGLLICAIGRAATRQIDGFVKQDKVYEAEMTLGATSDTYDSQGLIVAREVEAVSRELIEKTLLKFVGEQWQVPPMYSAKKVAGQKLYELARKGIEIKREPCRIIITRLEL
ncbi:MAG TPA: tRNA pseudouridine(55) synthase TruB, partial [bacterium]|nr:tRNA pseudouridine(55) synthase TruB [bacterium]